MASAVLWAESLPRKFNTLPHLRTIEHWQDFRLNSGQCDSLQYCFRLSSHKVKRLQVRVDNVLYEVGFPHLMIKQPGQKIEFLNADSADVIYFSYNPEAAAFFARLGLDKNFTIAEIALPESLERARELFAAAREHLSEPGFADQLDLVCYNLIHEAVLYLTAQKSNISDNDKKILKIASYLQTHFTEKNDLDSLAGKAGFSRRNFLRYWANYFKMTPGEYINNLKLLEAKRLLKETSLTNNNIAKQLGFCDEGYFCRFFRRHIGQTPRQYRES